MLHGAQHYLILMRPILIGGVYAEKTVLLKSGNEQKSGTTIKQNSNTKINHKNRFFSYPTYIYYGF